VAKLTAGDAFAYEAFGISVAVDGDTVVVGTSGYSDSVYVFRTTDGGATYPQVAELTGDNQFGISVAIAGNTVLIGDYVDGYGGAVYVFRTTDGVTYVELAKLTASDGASNDNFGRSVAIDGQKVVVGAYQGGNAGPGSTYVFLETLTTPKPTYNPTQRPTPAPISSRRRRLQQSTTTVAFSVRVEGSAEFATDYAANIVQELSAAAQDGTLTTQLNIAADAQGVQAPTAPAGANDYDTIMAATAVDGAPTPRPTPAPVVSAIPAPSRQPTPQPSQRPTPRPTAPTANDATDDEGPDPGATNGSSGSRSGDSDTAAAAGAGAAAGAVVLLLACFGVWYRRKQRIARLDCRKETDALELSDIHIDGGDAPSADLQRYADTQTAVEAGMLSNNF
jgi:hypothetical protein